ncbi:MAG: hypothetical protein ABI746_06130 [Dermatophilaceae bacterium]
MTTTNASEANADAVVDRSRHAEWPAAGCVAELDERSCGCCLAVADFAASLAVRLLSETSCDGQGSDDEYLLGYARAMQDLSEALRVHRSWPA